MEAAAAPARAVRVRGVTPGWALAAVAFLILALVVGVVVGPVDLGVGDVLQSIAAKLGVPGVQTPLSPTAESILWDLRVPRVLLAALVGGMLALAGATYQGVFRNPLADPYLLGVAAGAGLGATLAIAYLPHACRARAAAACGLRRWRGGRRHRVRDRPCRRPRARLGDARPRGCHRGALLHRAPDVRPAAEHGHAAGGHVVDPRQPPEHGLGRCADRSRRTSSSRAP